MSGYVDTLTTLLARARSELVRRMRVRRSHSVSPMGHRWMRASQLAPLVGVSIAGLLIVVGVSGLPRAALLGLAEIVVLGGLGGWGLPYLTSLLYGFPVDRRVVQCSWWGQHPLIAVLGMAVLFLRVATSLGFKALYEWSLPLWMDGLTWGGVLLAGLPLALVVSNLVLGYGERLLMGREVSTIVHATARHRWRLWPACKRQGRRIRNAVVGSVGGVWYVVTTLCDPETWRQLGRWLDQLGEER